MRWRYTPLPSSQVHRLGRQFTLSPIASSLLARLGLTEPEEVKTFIKPLLRNLSDPFELKNLDRAVHRLRQAMNSGEDILIFGDYDVDGVTSIALLIGILQQFGTFPRYIVPKRLTEGYGLSRVAIDRAIEKGRPGLLIAVDCGTNAHDEVAYLNQQGIDVIIIDHHTSTKEHAPDCLLVNPHLCDNRNAPWSELCSVGLVFKLIHGLLKQLRQEGDGTALEIQLKDYLDLVALGTIADLVPLRGENRILAKAGLRSLRNSRRPGLNALFEVSRINIGEEVSPFDVSFKLGPRINASGRLADASLPIEMLLSKDWRHCNEAARKLDDFNSERQHIERKISLEAEEVVATQLLGAEGYVLYNRDWHPGVVGIVASRLVQKFHRPSIVLGTEGDLAKGSGRSIPGINLVDVLQSCDSCLYDWGGHPMAVGLSLLPDQVPRFQEKFDDAIKRTLGGRVPEKEIQIACWISIEDVSSRLLDEMTIFQPFGQGNPEPVFGLQDTILRRPTEVFGKGHFRFRLDSGSSEPISGVAWKQSGNRPSPGKPIDMALRINWNVWKGRKSIQAELVDWRPSSA